MRRLLATAMLALVAAACASESRPEGGPQAPAGPVTLRTNAESYKPGDKGTVTLVNGSPSDVGYNLCFVYLSLERFEGGAWKSVTASLGPEDLACTAELRLLTPGKTDSGEITIPATLAAGNYRVVHNVEIAGSRVKVFSQDFAVAA